MTIFELTTKYRRHAHCRGCDNYELRKSDWDFKTCYGNGEQCLHGKMAPIIHDIQKEEE